MMKERPSVDSSQQAVAEQSRQIVVHRPTEGQLRWAQFHHRRRAHQVRANVEALYQTPATIHEVPDACSEDGNSTESSSSTGATPRRPKPTVSRGRRALLRVSQRRFRDRSETIRLHGFRRTVQGESANNSSSEEDDDEDALASIFAEGTVWKRRRRKRKQSDGRGKRFDEAFHALMMSVAAAQQPQFAAVQTPVKIWTRPTETPMVNVNYDAIRQMGIPTATRKSMLIQPSDMPMDRGASWLVHLPKTEKVSNETRKMAAAKSYANVADDYDVSQGVEGSQGQASPVRQRFRDIVTDFQNKSAPLPPEPIDYHSAPTMRLNKYFAQMEDIDEKKEDGSPLGATRLSLQQVQERIRKFEQLPNDEEELQDILRSMDPDFLEEMEAMNPGVKDRLRALYMCESSPSVKELARIVETPKDKEEKPQGVVKTFVARMEKALKKENLLSADGKLHKPTFAKLVNQYLLEAKGQNMSPWKRQPMVDSVVSKFQESEETNSIIDCEGHLDTPVLEHLVTRYLAELTGQDEDQVREANDWESLQKEEYLPRPECIRVLARQMRQQVKVCLPKGEEEWCEIVERSFMAALPSDQAVGPPLWTVQKIAERCATLIPEAWDQINTIEEVIEAELQEAKRIYEGGYFSMAKSGAAPQFLTPRAKKSVDSPRVKRFITHVKQTADVEPLVQNGAFHMPTFTKLINRYWAAVEEETLDFESARSPLALARAKRSSVIGKAIPQAPQEPKSPGRVLRFISNMEEALHDRTLVDADGCLDHKALEELVGEQFEKANSSDDGDANEEFTSASDFFRFLRSSNKKPPGRNAEPDSKAGIPGLETPGGIHRHLSFDDASHEQNYVDGTTHSEHEPTKKGTSNLAGVVTDKVGGLFGRLFHRDDSSTQSKDDLQAVAAHRKKQDERRLSDDTSSLSSFRALPDGLKNVVMNIRRMSRTAPDAEGMSSGGMSAEYIADEHMSSASEAFSSVAARSRDSEGHSEFSPERMKSFHKKVMEKSALIGGGEASKFIIDTDGSEASYDGVNPDILASLLLSPTILTKRHQQAIRAIETRNWEQVSYLITANPWLCEMTDVNTNQYLLHKLALYGGGESTVDRSTGEVVAVRYPPAPTELNTDIVRLFPSSVHKFDTDGNTPLHMACAAANASMVGILGDRFPSGATVRNEDGLLPIHLVILACGSPRAVTYGDAQGSTDLIRNILEYFPAAVAIPDDEGNLPIHTAATVLRGDVGVKALHLLLDEAARQLDDPYGARFRRKITMDDFDATSVDTGNTASTNIFDDVVQCTMVTNDAGETPLICAIHARAGWEVINALLQGQNGCKSSALIADRNQNNSLHLLLGERYQDAAAALSILKHAPETAGQRNEDGMLPIEIACMQMLAPEVILAIVLVDLPVDLDSKDSVKLREKQGSSWWYLVCESDDHFVGVVEEVVSMCSYPQIRELCFMEGNNGETLIARATPKCRASLQEGLRFLGRFEFIGQSALYADPSRGIKIFDAVDYGATEAPYDVAQRVILKCFADAEIFLEESRIVREESLDFSLFEKISIFNVGEPGNSDDRGSEQFCISIERPQLTLGGVVSGMLGNEDCQTNPEVRSRYALKVFSVLRIVCKALLSLHKDGLVHGNLSLTHIGKYDGKWKVAEILGLQNIGETFDPDRFSPSSPPESIVPLRHSDAAHKVTFRTDLTTSAAIDVWAFGKLALEALTGEPLVNFDESTEFDDDHRALMDIMHWNDFNLDEVAQKLRRWFVTEAGVNLILSCLSPSPEDRPSIQELLEHPLWKELRRQGR